MTSVEVVPGVTLILVTPAGAHEEPESALPVIDVSAVPGARVAVRRGFASEAAVVRAACVIAPSDRWAPGLEELVLGRATGLAQASLAVPVERWEAGPIRTTGARFEQRVAGRAGDREVASIAHTLGFVGADHEALVCSIACASRGDAAPATACEDVIASSSLQGPLEGPPPPSLLVRTVLAAAESPYEAAAIFAVACAVVVAVIVIRRPKVPGRRLFP